MEKKNNNNVIVDDVNNSNDKSSTIDWQWFRFAWDEDNKLVQLLNSDFHRNY